jgi:C_GCAxxG_C_C family probable redox protein
VLLAVCRKCQIDTPDGVIPHIARGFAGGIGNTGAVCGAVVGAVMGVGLALEGKQEITDMLDELRTFAGIRRDFEAEMGSIQCRELTGVDLTTEEGIDELMQSDVPEKVCMRAVNLAEDLATGLIEQSTPAG